MQCDQSQMVPLLHYLPDSAFSASSFLSNAFKPEAARIDSRPGDGTVSNLKRHLHRKTDFLQFTKFHVFDNFHSLVLMISFCFHVF
jgi:hypothetical protein